MLKKRRAIFLGALLVWLIFVMCDFALAGADKKPVFAVPVFRYKDGGSTEYFGLGYKVIKYVDLTAESGPQVAGVEFGSWFMKFSHPRENENYK
jgi:hypothetical protein